MLAAYGKTKNKTDTIQNSTRYQVVSRYLSEAEVTSDVKQCGE